MNNIQLHHSIDILPPHLQQEVANYVAFLHFKYGNTQITTEEIKKKRLPLKFGAGKDLIQFISEDFDEPLAHFNEYIP